MKHTMKLRPNPFRMILCGERHMNLDYMMKNVNVLK